MIYEWIMNNTLLSHWTRKPTVLCSAVSTAVGFSFLSLNFSFHWKSYNFSCPCVQTFQVLANFGVSKVVASGHPDFKVGDLVWGITGWEEYTLVTNPESLFKIKHPELPLSYYTGVLGEFTLSTHSSVASKLSSFSFFTLSGSEIRMFWVHFYCLAYQANVTLIH